MNDNTTTADELSDRIADVLAGEASVNTITTVITSAELERDRLHAEREAARAVAFDPRTRSPTSRPRGVRGLRRSGRLHA